MDMRKTRLSSRRIATISTVVLLLAAAICIFGMTRPLHAAPDARYVEDMAPEPLPLASMRGLPPEVREALVRLCNPCEFADSDAPWNATDVLVDGVPQRRLVKVEKRDSGWLVHYRHGGFATHEHTAVFSLAPTAHLVAGSSCLPAHEVCEW